MEKVDFPRLQDPDTEHGTIREFFSSTIVELEFDLDQGLQHAALATLTHLGLAAR